MWNRPLCLAERVSPQRAISAASTDLSRITPVFSLKESKLKLHMHKYKNRLYNVELIVTPHLSNSLKRSLVVWSVASGTAWPESSCEMLWNSSSRSCCTSSWERLIIGSPEYKVFKTGRKSCSDTRCTGVWKIDT